MNAPDVPIMILLLKIEKIKNIPSSLNLNLYYKVWHFLLSGVEQAFELPLYERKPVFSRSLLTADIDLSACLFNMKGTINISSRQPVCTAKALI